MLELAVAVFVASLVGSIHCVGMCGPFVALTSLGRGPTRRPLAPLVTYNLGRGLAYAAVGAVAGTVGMALDAGGALAGLQRTATTVAGVTMIAIGGVWLVDLLVGDRDFTGPRTFVASAITERLRRGFTSAKTLRPAPRALALGVLTSFMPCGWLYAFAITAAGTGSALHGSLTMIAFWLGTIPMLAIMGAGLNRLSPLLRRRLPVVMASALLAVGLFTALRRAPIQVTAEHARASATPEVPSQAPCHGP